ncbi:MAG: 6-carboxytetrahydropterin synthase [Calditrichaeota bacterium]|nr:MAG: 6-carboxytetrahydropterin synthase [Calditrichota bacterium]
MKLGIIEHIDCAHYLPGHTHCGTMHGHTYKVELVVEGEMQDGMLIDFADLKKDVRQILSVYDHTLLNNVIKFPTVENIALEFREKLGEKIPFSFTLKVWEGYNKWCEVEHKAKGE